MEYDDKRGVGKDDMYVENQEHTFTMKVMDL